MTGQNASVLHIKRPRLRDEITHGEITENVTNPNTSLSSSLKSQGLQISPMHSIHLWINPPPSELGPPEEQWPRQYCALLQSLPTAKGRLQPGRIAPTTIIHGTSLPLPTALQTQALAFSHHTRCTHTHTPTHTGQLCVGYTTSIHQYEGRRVHLGHSQSRQHACPALPGGTGVKPSQKVLVHICWPVTFLQLHHRNLEWTMQPPHCYVLSYPFTLLVKHCLSQLWEQQCSLHINGMLHLQQDRASNHRGTAVRMRSETKGHLAEEH